MDGIFGEGPMTEIEVPDELDHDQDKVRDVFSGKDVGQVEWEWFIDKSFELTGVGDEDVKVAGSYRSDDATHFSFILDGKCYTAVEDPSDGYRSSLAHVAITKGVTIKNRFEAVKVTARRAAATTDEIVELVDDLTGKVVIQFGTSNTDDYYPGFVGCFMPANMVINESPEKRLERQEAERAAIEQVRLSEQRESVLTDSGWGSW